MTSVVTLVPVNDGDHVLQEPPTILSLRLFEWDDVLSFDENDPEEVERRLSDQELLQLLPVEVEIEASSVFEENTRPDRPDHPASQQPQLLMAHVLPPRTCPSPDAGLELSRSVSALSASSVQELRSASSRCSSRTSSIYAVNESSDSQAVLEDAFHLDFRELVALGQGPGRLRLSNEEAEALPKMRFDTPELQVCSICQEAFRRGMLLTRLGCGHVFHINCLVQWVQQSAQCPNCRAQIQPGNVMAAG